MDNKLEAFRDWILTSGNQKLWSSDEEVIDIIKSNPRGKFKEYLKAMQQNVNAVQTPETDPIQTECEANMFDKNSAKENAEVISIREKMAKSESTISEAIGDEKHVLRIGRAMSAQLEIQAKIIAGNRADKIAASVINRSTTWANENPKTALAVGTVTVVAAGVGVYHLAKMAKQYI